MTSWKPPENLAHLKIILVCGSFFSPWFLTNDRSGNLSPLPQFLQEGYQNGLKPNTLLQLTNIIDPSINRLLKTIKKFKSSYKSHFLVTFISTRRIGELSCEEPYLRILPDCVIFRTMPAFLSKATSAHNSNQEIVLPVKLSLLAKECYKEHPGWKKSFLIIP